MLWFIILKNLGCTTKKLVNIYGNALLNITDSSVWELLWKAHQQDKIFSEWVLGLGIRVERNIKAHIRIVQEGRCSWKENQVKGKSCLFIFISNFNDHNWLFLYKLDMENGRVMFLGKEKEKNKKKLNPPVQLLVKSRT